MRNDSYEEQSAGHAGFRLDNCRFLEKNNQFSLQGLTMASYMLTMRCVCAVIVKILKI